MGCALAGSHQTQAEMEGGWCRRPAELKMLPDGALTCLTGGRKSPVSVFPGGRLFLGCFIFPQVPFCTFLGCWCGWKNKS